MRLTVLQLQTKALQEERLQTGTAVSKQVESIKHLLWHGNVEEALERLADLILCQGRSESRPLRRSKRGPLWRRGQGGRLAVIGGSEGVGGYGRSVSPRTLFLRLTMVFWFWGRRSVALRRP